MKCVLELNMNLAYLKAQNLFNLRLVTAETVV